MSEDFTTRNVLGSAKPERTFWEVVQEEMMLFGPDQVRDQVERVIREAQGDGIIYLQTSASRLPIIDVSLWQGDPPPREFAVDSLLPLRQCTMLTGQGGVGKSLLSQMMMTCLALGLPFLGMATRAMKALYLTAEDDADELWRRQDAICRALGVPISEIGGALHLVSLCGDIETALASFDSDLKLQPSDRWHQLERAVRQLGVQAFAIDNVTDAMAGDLNDVHQVAQFVNMVTGLAIDTDGVALLLHHPNKGGDDWLGSVAWHNKVRSRLLLTRPENAADPDMRVLVNPKANYGPMGTEISLRWIAGTFVRDDDLPEGLRKDLDQSTRAAGDNAIFLNCLAERLRQRRAVSDKRSPTFAPKVFAEMPESKGIGKRRLESAMERLFRLGRIERAALWKGDDRKQVFGLQLVAGDCAGNTMRATQETATKGAEIGAGNAGNTHTLSYGEEGGPPSGWPAPSDDDLDWRDFDPPAGF